MPMTSGECEDFAACPPDVEDEPQPLTPHATATNAAASRRTRGEERGDWDAGRGRFGSGGG
jgi:hypothetical protein